MLRFTKSVVIVLVIAVASIGLQSCNTFRGAGKDIRKGGEAIENSSVETQRPAVSRLAQVSADDI